MAEIYQFNLLLNPIIMPNMVKKIKLLVGIDKNIFEPVNAINIDSEKAKNALLFFEFKSIFQLMILMKVVPKKSKKMDSPTKPDSSMVRR